MIPCSSGTDSIIGSVFVFFETQMARASIISGASDDTQAYESAYSVVSLLPLELCSRGAEGALALKRWSLWSAWNDGARQILETASSLLGKEQ